MMLAAALLFATFTLSSGRHYLLHVPPHPADPAPLVIAFHGGSQTAEDMERMSEFDVLSDRDGFLVAYPQGVDNSWADGRGTTDADVKHVDDVAFTRAVIADIAKSHRIDTTRIYATGPSNGGLLTSRLGCEMADTFAAIGPVIGTMASKLVPQCHPTHAMPVIGISGVDDPLMPFAGGEEGGAKHLGKGGRVAGVRETQELWAKLNDCKASVVVSKIPNRVDDGTAVVTRSYSSCRDGANVLWFEIAGGGHRWPPQKSPRPGVEALARRALGVSSQNVDAAAELWSFFKAHRKAAARP